MSDLPFEALSELRALLHLPQVPENNVGAVGACEYMLGFVETIELAWNFCISDAVLWKVWTSWNVLGSNILTKLS